MYKITPEAGFHGGGVGGGIRPPLRVPTIHAHHTHVESSLLINIKKLSKLDVLLIFKP